MPGEAHEEIEWMAQNDERRAEEGLVELRGENGLYYKHIEELTPGGYVCQAGRGGGAVYVAHEPDGGADAPDPGGLEPGRLALGVLFLHHAENRMFCILRYINAVFLLILLTQK